MYWAWAYRLVICTAAWQPISCACPISIWYMPRRKWDWLPLLQTRVHWMLSMQYVAVPFRELLRKPPLLGRDVWKERRLELACEGDRWYDYVRLAYYDSQRAINELKAQRRDVYYSLGTTYKAYYENGSWTVNPDETRYNPDAKAPNVTVSSFTLPFPTEDVVFNPNLMKDPVHVDVRSEFSY